MPTLSLAHDQQLIEQQNEEYMLQVLASYPTIEELKGLQEYMLSDEYEDHRMKLVNDHVLADGLYTRTMDLPKGSLAFGAKHRTGMVTFLAKGDVTFITSKGPTRYTAPSVWTDEPGVKRAAYAHEDSVVVTVCPSSSSSIEDIEKELIIPEEEV